MRRCAILFLVVLGCTALIEKLEIEDDDRMMFHIETFGYEPGGKLELDVKNFQLMVPQDYQAPDEKNFNIAFVIQHSSNDSPTRADESAEHCFHKEISVDSYLGEEVIPLSSRSDWRSLRISRTMNSNSGGFYHLYFSNCEANTHASFSVTLTQYNIDPITKEKIFLSVGTAQLPTLFFLVCAGFMGELLLWLYTIRQHPHMIRTIHYLMTILLIFKILTLFCEAFKYHSLKVSGHNDGWSTMYYIFSFLKGTLMFVVIILIGTGWSYIKPFLTERDKQIVLGMLVAQVLVNVAMVVVDEMAPGQAGWVTWSDLLHLLDMICCCAVLLPIVWSIKHLRSVASADGKAAKNMERLKNFRTFYLSVVCYIYFTRIIVFLLTATLPFELTWLGTIFAEGAALLFYGSTGYLFRPKPESSVFYNDSNDDVDAAVPLTNL